MLFKNHLPIFFLFVASTIFLSSCKLTAPSFKNVENLKFERAGTQGIKLGAEAVFYNPNGLKCTVKDIAVDVIVNDKLVGILGEKADVVVDKKSDFRIPLGISINPDGSILSDIKTIFGIITNKQVELALVGKIKVKVLGVTFPVPIKHKQQFNLGSVKN